MHAATAVPIGFNLGQCSATAVPIGFNLGQCSATALKSIIKLPKYRNVFKGSPTG